MKVFLILSLLLVCGLSVTTYSYHQCIEKVNCDQNCKQQYETYCQGNSQVSKYKSCKAIKDNFPKYRWHLDFRDDFMDCQAYCRKHAPRPAQVYAEYLEICSAQKLNYFGMIGLILLGLLSLYI